MVRFENALARHVLPARRRLAIRMLWFDLGVPKDVLFFKPFIERLTDRGESLLVTSRGGEDFRELSTLLRVHHLDAVVVGEYGGGALARKLQASLDRQLGLLELVKGNPVDRLITFANVDSCRVAFGLGIPVVNFCDLPTKGDGKPLTPVARLTLPLSAKVLHPFVVPETIFTRFLETADVIRYDFLDPVLYLREQTPDRSLIGALPLDATKKTVCFREEEYMASYVTSTQDWVFEALGRLDVNLIVIPRYGSERIRQALPDSIVVDSGVELSAVLPFVDVMIGGGGTINIEAAYWGTPVISTRSFVSHYDQYLISQELMCHADSTERFTDLFKKLSGRRTDSSILRAQAKKVNIDSLFHSMGV